MMKPQFTTKARIIPEEWKESIDTILEQELLNANRYFAQVNPRIRDLVDKEANLPPFLFLNDLKRRWEWHHRFYEEFLEPACGFFLEKNGFELSPLQVGGLVNIYEVLSLVDQATLVPTAAIKLHVERQTDRLKRSMNLSSNEVFKLLTPPRDSFFVVYQKDHLA
jgi:hypothetical protein